MKSRGDAYDFVEPKNSRFLFVQISYARKSQDRKIRNICLSSTISSRRQSASDYCKTSQAHAVGSGGGGGGHLSLSLSDTGGVEAAAARKTEKRNFSNSNIISTWVGGL